MCVSETFLSRGLDPMVTFNPICVQQDTQLDALLERLYTTGFHHWPVIDAERTLIGIVSDHDIVRAAIEREAAAEVFDTPRDTLRLAVKDFMRHPVITIEADGTGDDVLDHFLQHGFHSLPVIKDGCLMGMITSTDFIREFAYSQHPAKDIPIGDIYDRLPHLVDAEMLLDDLRIELILNEATYCLVTQGDCMLGVLSERDVRRHKCRAMTRRLYEGSEEKPVRAVEMLNSSSCIPATTTLGEVAHVMHEQHVTAAMVCSRGDDPSGVISLNQILGHLANFEAAETV
ncbi:CBS domain-containing protein [Blastopirellula marina]|uniref:CBS domain-containing protein n=1 Tax=Blastopirellula marina TaxID=124 RepID=A0A2S8GLG6_9BACT|nr:CBS domain-containing protein [Blastopirellula marina]PQO45276.1 hypothetical protein C5Y93_15075 [Blastopirellula marina]